MSQEEDWDKLPTIEVIGQEEDEWDKLPTIETIKPKKEEKYGLGYILGETLKGTARGAAEVAGTVTTGLPAFALGLAGQPAYGLYKQWKEGFKDVEKPWQLITKTFEKGKPAAELFHAGIYQPKDPIAQKTLTKMFYPFAKYDQAVDWVKTHVSSDPATQETIDWLGDLALVYGLSAGTGLIKGAFKAKTAPKISALKKVLLETEKVPEATKATIREIPDTILKGEVPEKLKALEAFDKYYEKVDTELAQMGKVPKGEKVKNAYRALKRATVDVSANIKRDLLKDFGELGKEAVIHHDLVRGAPKKSQYYISKSVSEIFGDLKPEQRKLIWKYIQAKRVSEVLDYKPEHKFPAEFSVEKNKFLIESIEKKLPDVADRAEAYFDIFREKLVEMLDEGLITEEGFKGLSTHDIYEPIQHIIKKIDPHTDYIIGGKKITVTSSGLKPFKEGSESIMEYNAELLMGEYITRADAYIMKNRANKAMYSIAEAFPDNGIVRKAKIIRLTKEKIGKALKAEGVPTDKAAEKLSWKELEKAGKAMKKVRKGKPVFEETPAGYQSITAMIDGKPRKLFMPESMANEWVLSDPIVNAQVANIAGWLSGSKILKPMATGLNPEFALTNFPRDIAHIWLTTNEYSPYIPKAGIQMGADLMATVGDAFLRKGSYFDYINEGGGMQFLTHQGKITSKVGGKLGQLQDVLGYLGETSEIWTRIALRRRALKRGASPHEATWQARNYLDFNQGGPVIKAIDTGVPYLNAGIQGTRGIFRAFAERPAQTTFKVAQIGTLSTGLYLANKYSNPECWNSISERDKEANFIITTPLKYKDKSGNDKHLFFKVAKDQGQRFFCTLFDGMMAKYLGDPVDGHQIWMGLQDALPIMPTQNMPPTFDALLGYVLNKDFWTKEDIWRGVETKTPKYKRNEYVPGFTHPALIEAGKYTGLSPTRLGYMLQQYFTSGNIYTSLTGEGIRAIMGQLPEHYKDRTQEEILLGMPFIRRVAEATNPYEPYEKKTQETLDREAMRRYHQVKELDVLFDGYYRKLEETGSRDDTLKNQILEYIKAQPAPDQGRLYDRFYKFGKLFHLSDKRWWLNVISANPEARAYIFYDRWKDVDDVEKKKLQQGLNKVPGVATDRFKSQLLQMMRKNNLEWVR